MGDAGQEVDIELLKQDVNIEQRAASNTLLWHVPNLHETSSAVLNFASKALVFDDMFPLEVNFNESYSLVDLELSNAPTDGSSGEEMSRKVTHQLSTDSYNITND